MAITPVITIRTDNSGFAPFTVHVDALASDFDGINIADCIFEWDFGDPNPPLNGHQDNNRYDSLGAALTNSSLVQGNFKNKTRFTVSTLDSGVDNTGYSNRSGDSNTEQQGINAAYTYYHNNGGTPFTITLRIINNGIASSSDTDTVTITAPTIYSSWTTAEINNPLHAVNSANSWVTIQVNNNFSDNPATGSSKSFSSFENAFTWITNFRSTTSLGGVNGRIRIVMSNASGQYTKAVASTINITTNNIVFTINDNNYQRVFRAMPASSGPLFNPASPTAMFVIKSGAKNIYFENMTFQGVSSFDSSESSSTPTSTSNIIPIEIQDASNVTFHNCGFVGCYNGLLSTSGSKIYLNKVICGGGGSNGYVGRSNLFQLTGDNIVLTAVEVSNFDRSTLYDKQSSIAYILTSASATIQWCHLDTVLSKASLYGDPNSDGSSDDYGFLFSTSSIANGGAIRTNSVTCCSFISNMLLQGCNRIYKTNEARFDGNYITVAGGGQKVSPASPTISSQFGAISLEESISGVTIVNNVFELKYNNLMGNVFCFVDSVDKERIKIANNTTILWSNISSLIGVWDFTTNGAAVSGVSFVNNLFVQNKIGVLCRYIRYEDSVIFDTFENNVYPILDGEVRFARVNGVSQDVSTWTSSFGANDDFCNVEIGDTFIERKFAYDSEKYPALLEYVTQLDYVNQDYTKRLRTSSAEWSTGASSVVPHLTLFPYSGSESSVISLVTEIARNRPTNANATLNDSKNAYLEVYDPDIQEQDDEGISSNKRLIGKSYGTRAPDVTTAYINLLNGVGDYIKTNIVTAETSDGIDITITYTNDGPVSQTAGIAAQRIGTIDFDYVFLGKNNSILFGQNSFSIENLPLHVLKNYATVSDSLTYPLNRFSPVTSYLTDNHAITISLLADFINSDKIVQEKTYGRVDFLSYPIGRGKTTLEWTNNTFNNHCLQVGETFTVTASIRISRDPSKWVKTTKPLKDYLQNSIEMTHTIDPRPIYLENLNSNFDGSTPLQLPTYYQIPQTGYATYRSTVIENVLSRGYERYMVWDIIGYNTGGLNYYPQILTGIYRNQTPWTTYPLMLSTISEVNRVGEEIPSLIFYQGYGDLTLTSVTAYGATATYGVIDFTDSSRMQKFYDEMDLAFDVFWASGIGLDFFGTSTNRNQIKNCIDLISSYKTRYPNAHFMGEKAKPDVFMFKMASYIFSDQGPYGPHDLANYLIPGNEHWMIDYGPTRTDEYANGAESLHRLKVFAEYGYVSGISTPVQYGGSFLVNSDEYEAVDRRFDFESVPLDYTKTEAPSAPTGLNYAFYRATRSTTYTTVTRKYIKLTWTPSVDPDFSHYIVYKSKITNQIVDSNPSNFQRKKYTKDALFYDTAVREGKTYYYQISAVDVFGNESVKASVFPVLFVSDDTVLSAPTNLTAVPNYNQGNINITWSS